MKNEWFETFFQGPAVDFWTRAMTPALTSADVDFLEKALEVNPGARLLDVPCGHGRHSIELARRGYRVTGIDISEEMLGLARAELAADWRKGDMRALDLEPSAFDGAFCLGNSFGYLDREGITMFLRALAAALKPGARLIVDTGVAAEWLTHVQRRWHHLGDLFILSDPRYDAVAGRLDIDYTFIRGGPGKAELETRPTSSYVFAASEICRMFEASGFEVASANGGYSGEPYLLGSPRLVLTAAKSR